MDRLEAGIKEIKEPRSGAGWQRFHDPKNRAMAIASEAGVLLAEYRWLSNLETDSFKSSKEIRRHVAAEGRTSGSRCCCSAIESASILSVVTEKLQTNRRNIPFPYREGRQRGRTQDMMNALTTDPEEGLTRTKTISKTAAVKRVAEAEERWTGRAPNLREIWRSLERVEEYMKRLTGQLEFAKKAQGQARKGW